MVPKKDERQLRITDIDRIIHEPARYMIMAYLYVVEKADFLFLLRQTELTKGNLSSHLSKLENAEYVKIEKTYKRKITQTFLNLSKKGRKEFEEYRKRMQQTLKNLPKKK